MIKQCSLEYLNDIQEKINDAAKAYRGNIPDDCYHEPYMKFDELSSEMNAGVIFCSWEESGILQGVMGIQK